MPGYLPPDPHLVNEGDEMTPQGYDDAGGAFAEEDFGLHCLRRGPQSLAFL